MEECGFTWHFWAVVAACASILLWIITGMYFASKKATGFGCSGERVSTEDSAEATRMMVGYLSDMLRLQNKEFTETSAGCDSLMVLKESNDIAKAVQIIHENGGRLVLRKTDSRDIENKKNTEMEVKKRLTALDIARSKRVKRKYKE